MTVSVRFWSKVARTGNVCECWIWTAATDKDGYGKFTVKKKDKKAHRFSYEETIGAIPDGMQIDHLCRNRPCVNPWHLEAVTSKENTHRGESPSALNRMKEFCPAGHRYDRISSAGDRVCTVCIRATTRKWYLANRRPKDCRGPSSGRTHCPYGHPYDQENTLVSGGRRRCRACGRKRTAEWRAGK